MEDGELKKTEGRFGKLGNAVSFVNPPTGSLRPIRATWASLQSIEPLLIVNVWGS